MLLSVTQSFKSGRLVIWLTTIVVVLAGLILVSLFIPYRPTPQDTIDHALDVIQPAQSSQQAGFSATTNRKVEIHQIQPLGTSTQLVLLTYEAVNSQPNGDSVAFCLEVRYISQRLVSGVFSYAAAARCQHDQPVSALELVSSIQDGNYVLGGVIDDTDIVSVRVTWLDKTETVIPVVEKGFLLVQPNKAGLSQAVGLDLQGNVVANSITHDPAVNFSPLDYTKTRQIPFADGVIVIGVYSQTSPYMLDCIELLFLTAENARKYLTGQAAFTSQRACLDPGGQVLGSIASTQVSTETIVAGRVLSESVTTVYIRWSDGTSQNVPVEDGLYFAHRGGSVVGFNDSGREVSRP